MKVLGIDFTSNPSRAKPITCLSCQLDGGVLRADHLQNLRSFQEFEATLSAPGPWIAGIDFPFGQSRKFIENIGWPTTWDKYVRQAYALGRNQFVVDLNTYRAGRPYGDKEHRRATDKAAGSVSPQKLYRIPVGLMFFEGAPRLIRAKVTIPHLQKGDASRVVVEAYPALVARRFIGRQSYKSDDRRNQTAAQHAARGTLLDGVLAGRLPGYGFRVEAPRSLADDPMGDQIDAHLCAIQAAWAWTQQANGFGTPINCDKLEGWIADPSLGGELAAPALA
jgi:Protein of unknown function (DUF429)